MDKFEAMSMLIEVVDQGSLSAASRSLRVPVPTLSRKVTELEAMLGTKLLIRTTRSLTLTDSGLTYVAAARRILEEIRVVEREAAGEMTAPKGELVITAPVMFGRLHVLPVVTEFLMQYQQINVQMLLGDRNLQMIDDHVDMAVRIGELEVSSMIATRIGSMRTVTCASPEFLDRHGRPIEPADLVGLPCIANETPMNVGGWMFAVPGRDPSFVFPCRPRLSVTSAEAAMDAARRHLGLVRLFQYQVVDAIEDGTLEIVLQRYELAPASVHVLHVAHGHMPLKMRNFLSHAVPRLKSRLRRVASGQVER